MEFYNKITFNENNEDDSYYEPGSTAHNFNDYLLPQHDSVTFDSTLKFIENMQLLTPKKQEYQAVPIKNAKFLSAFNQNPFLQQMKKKSSTQVQNSMVSSREDLSDVFQRKRIVYQKLLARNNLKKLELEKLMLSDRLKYETQYGNDNEKASPFFLKPRDYDDNSRNISTSGTTNKTHLISRPEAASRQSQSRQQMTEYQKSFRISQSRNMSQFRDYGETLVGKQVLSVNSNTNSRSNLDIVDHKLDNLEHLQSQPQQSQRPINMKIKNRNQIRTTQMKQSPHETQNISDLIINNKSFLEQEHNKNFDQSRITKEKNNQKVFYIKQYQNDRDLFTPYVKLVQHAEIKHSRIHATKQNFQSSHKQPIVQSKDYPLIQQVDEFISTFGNQTQSPHAKQSEFQNLRATSQIHVSRRRRNISQNFQAARNMQNYIQVAGSTQQYSGILRVLRGQQIQ